MWLCLAPNWLWQHFRVPRFWHISDAEPETRQNKMKKQIDLLWMCQAETLTIHRTFKRAFLGSFPDSPADLGTIYSPTHFATPISGSYHKHVQFCILSCSNAVSCSSQFYWENWLQFCTQWCSLHTMNVKLTTDVFSQDSLGFLQCGHQAVYWGLKQSTVI